MHTNTRMVIERLIVAHEQATDGGDEHSDRARGFFDLPHGPNGLNTAYRLGATDRQFYLRDVKKSG